MENAARYIYIFFCIWMICKMFSRCGFAEEYVVFTKDLQNTLEVNTPHQMSYLHFKLSERHNFFLFLPYIRHIQPIHGLQHACGLAQPLLQSPPALSHHGGSSSWPSCWLAPIIQQQPNIGVHSALSRLKTAWGGSAVLT